MRNFRSNRWIGIGIVLGFLLMWAPGIFARAQQTSTPSLRNRSQGEQDQAPENRGRSGQSNQYSTLPEDVWGTYEFEHGGESIELDLDRNKLSGYLSLLGDSETDTTTPLTFFFDQSSIDDTEISFQTRVLHGIWYSFRGTIVRGNGKERTDEGYYVLRGVLAVHHPQDSREKSADETIERRNVHFKSMPQ